MQKSRPFSILFRDFLTERRAAGRKTGGIPAARTWRRTIMGEILVAGGGAAGMMAAVAAARAGASVTLLEQNEKLGNKI